MKKIIGRFYWKLTDSKNLIGEFSNNDCKRNYTESADLILPNPSKANADKFVGEYFSTWHDESGGRHESVLAKLIITPKHENIFKLEWCRVQDDGQIVGEPFFWGEGMLCDGMLIGDYRNFRTP